MQFVNRISDQKMLKEFLFCYEKIKKLSPFKEIMQTIIMYNDDIIIINSNGITKANDI